MTSRCAPIVWFALGILALCALGQSRSPGPGAARQARAHEQKRRGAPEKRSVPVQELREVAAISFPTPSPASTLVPDYCDGEGNIYLVYGASNPRGGPVANNPTDLNAQPVTKLTLDSQSLTEYATPSLSGYQSLRRSAFSVDVFGNVYALFRGYRSSFSTQGAGIWSWVIVKFDGDGSVDSAVALQNPPSGWLRPLHFEAFASGGFLVTGTVHSSGMSSGQQPGTKFAAGEGPFTGVFDRYGHFVQEVKLPKDILPGSKAEFPDHIPLKRRLTRKRGAPARTGVKPGTANPEGGKTAKGENPATAPSKANWATIDDLSVTLPGPEDTVYLLRPSNPAILYAVSSDGQVVHEAHVQYPGRNLRVVDASPAGRSSVVIEFFGTKPDGRGGFRGYFLFSLVDPATGEVTARYKLPGKRSPFFACATGPNDLEFIRSARNSHLEVEKYSAN